MSNVINLFKNKKCSNEYSLKIATMDKMELLEEMVRFQEKRSRIGHLTLEMMLEGRCLFEALEQNAETIELRILCRSYKRHLEHELAALKNNF